MDAGRFGNSTYSYCSSSCCPKNCCPKNEKETKKKVIDDDDDDRTLKPKTNVIDDDDDDYCFDPEDRRCARGKVYPYYDAAPEQDVDQVCFTNEKIISDMNHLKNSAE
jgi:hypothetical protein